MSELNISNNVSSEAKEDILYLHNRIQGFVNGTEDEERFRSFRLSRGVYGQRQEGVQMIRIKLPFGRLSADQLVRIADIADKYATEKMHLTTRQDIQVHYVKLADSPQVWAELEDANITLREACGNTVRNVTASADAGINPNELFDVSPYAHAFFEYFLRNPICQEMGRKFKVSFSSDDNDTAFSFMHDLGFIPRIQDGKRGFKVMVAGGLGAQPMLAQELYAFLPEEEFIPLSEAVIRVFDRHGERASRGKARMKFLIKKIGFDAFKELIEEQKLACINKTYEIDESRANLAEPATRTAFDAEIPSNEARYQAWLDTNVFEQKQEGFYGVYIKLPLGNIYNEKARAFAQIVKDGFVADDIRITVNQGFLLKYARKEALVGLFNRLEALGLADPGFDSTADITACPGTDTCNLGIASSTGISAELERLMNEDFSDLIYNHDIKIKISGCMNACGQHSIANVGFQGMSIKKGAFVMPAMQILLGGGFDKERKATVADKVVKVPSKRAPQAFAALMTDFNENALEGEYFNNYYRRQKEADKMYFFTLLKPFTVTTDVTDDFFVDWGENEKYVKAVGVGECAGVVLDLVGTLIADAKEKFDYGTKALESGNWQDSIYHSYNSFVVAAKALLTGEGIACNTQKKIVADFDENMVEKGFASFGGTSFAEQVFQLDSAEPSLEFAQKYHAEAKAFMAQVDEIRTEQITRMEAQEA
ncbi:MAG: nitrite/sulfite reductase [Cytophagales bacterium]|nr:nitrite/sulfite reductase [Cytophagales bacterium]